MAASSGVQHERIPLPEYRRQLRAIFGAGNFRIERDGRIRALCGTWLIWGRVGDRETIQRLFAARPGQRQRGVVAIETAIILSALAIALVGGCTTVDRAIGERWPGIGLAEVTVELVDFAAERIQARRAAEGEQ